MGMVGVMSPPGSAVSMLVAVALPPAEPPGPGSFCSDTELGGSSPGREVGWDSPSQLQSNDRTTAATTFDRDFRTPTAELLIPAQNEPIQPG